MYATDISTFHILHLRGSGLCRAVKTRYWEYILTGDMQGRARTNRINAEEGVDRSLTGGRGHVHAGMLVDFYFYK